MISKSRVHAPPGVELFSELSPCSGPSHRRKIYGCFFYFPKPSSYFRNSHRWHGKVLFLLQLFLTPVLRPGFEPTSVELHQIGAFEGRSIVPTKLHDRGRKTSDFP